MTNLRPECIDSTSKALPYDTSLFLIRDAVRRRRSLIRGQLHDSHGKHCALGCFWDDNPDAALQNSLIQEVAAVNDSLPIGTKPSVRWKKVNEWLRWKVKVLATKEEQ